MSGLLAGYPDVITARNKIDTKMHDTKLHGVNFMPDESLAIDTLQDRRTTFSFPRAKSFKDCYHLAYPRISCTPLTFCGVVKSRFLSICFSISFFLATVDLCLLVVSLLNRRSPGYVEERPADRLSVREEFLA